MSVTKILHVEDRIEDAELVEMMLTESGSNFVIDHVINKNDYAKKLDKQAYDIIIADYHLPGFGEYEALEMAQKDSPETPYVILSSSIGEAKAVEILRKGATDYILKDNLQKLPFVLDRVRDDILSREKRNVVYWLTELLAKWEGYSNEDAFKFYNLFTEKLQHVIPLKKLSIQMQNELGQVSTSFFYDGQNAIANRIHDPHFEVTDRCFQKMEWQETSNIEREEFELGVPLFAGERFVGVMGLTLHTVNFSDSFKTRKKEFLAAISEQLTLFIDKRLKAEELNIKREELLRYQSRLLSTQINPHFIFNILNSVQYHILENDVSTSINYISSFSNLIRGVLENSMRDYITLDQELDWLTNYLNLETDRFKGKMEFKIEVEPTISIENIMIPPMILQPFVENAIVHGIAPLPKPNIGEIKITLEEAEKMIMITIDDNGVGRTKADENKRLREAKKPKSYGMSITQTKIDILNTIYEGGFGVEIIDKKDNDGNPAGTQVIVYIPNDLA